MELTNLIISVLLSTLFILELVSIYRNYTVALKLKIERVSKLSTTRIHLPALLYALILVVWTAYNLFK